MKVSVSAPGKLILLGEHAVIYGYPCIVTAVDKRIYVTAQIIKGKKDKIITPQVKESRFVCESIAYFRERFKIDQPIKVTTRADFSHNIGLGSSAATTVATFKALSSLFQLSLSKREIFDLSYRVTLKIQGAGSGFDVAAAIFGRTIYFVTAGKVIEQQNITKIPLVVGYSGVKADTSFYIRQVAQNFKIKRNKIQNIFVEISRLVEEAKKSLINQDYPRLGRLMSKNHQLLQRLGVSIPKLDKMVDVAQKAGAYGAKLSGAGGGDCMIALVSEEKKKAVEEAIRKVGGEIIKVGSNAQGVKVEKAEFVSKWKIRKLKKLLTPLANNIFQRLNII